MASFRSLASRAPATHAESAGLTTARKVADLKFLRSRLAPNTVKRPALVVCLLVDYLFANAPVWLRFLEDAAANGVNIAVKVFSMGASSETAGIPDTLRTDITVTKLKDSASARLTGVSGGFSEGFLRLLASVELLRAALADPVDATHVLLMSGDAIPIASAKDMEKELKPLETWMAVPHVS
jgi:hypothetical protein